MKKGEGDDGEDDGDDEDGATKAKGKKKGAVADVARDSLVA